MVHIRTSIDVPCKTVMVHWLVLLAFIGPRPYGLDACHNNGKHADNRASNLRWGTRSSNMHDRVAHGYQQPMMNKNAKLTPARVRKIRASKASCVSLGRRYGVHWKTISRVRHLHCWKRVT